MCTECFEDEENGPAFAPDEILRLARLIETDMGGELLPERAWAIYLGEATGALDWRSLERMGRALEAARLAASLAVAPPPAP